MKQHVFGPAGMTGSSAPTSLTAPVPGLAQGHVFTYGMWLPRPELPGFGGGEGNIVSTAEDMAHWLIVQNNQGRAGDGTPVVTAAGKLPDV
jgi:CubicO group peptidase (beta-lactamase class C family)